MPLASREPDSAGPAALGVPGLAPLPGPFGGVSGGVPAGGGAVLIGGTGAGPEGRFAGGVLGVLGDGWLPLPAPPGGFVGAGIAGTLGAQTTAGVVSVVGAVVGSVVGAVTGAVVGAVGAVGAVVPPTCAGLASRLGVPCRRTVNSVAPAASGDGIDGLAGPGAVDSPITGPMTRGCPAGREHAPDPPTASTATNAVPRCVYAM
jgi:hypothetical protein